MVKYFLLAKGELQGITQIEPGPQFEYMFRIQCTNCRTNHPKNIGINTSDLYELNKAKVSFIFRCKECKTESNATIERTKEKWSSSNEWSKIILIDARGMEFTKFVPEGKFIGKGSKSTFDIDLEEGEFYDYDEHVGEEVSVTDVEWRVERS